MMKLKTLLQNNINNIDKIKTSMLMNYYSDENDLEYENIWESYNDVISWLFGVEPIPQSEHITTILVQKWYPDEELPGDWYAHVSGWDGEQTWGLELTDWHMWLDMEIDEDSYKEFNEVDIIVHILWEMTFFGFSNEKVIEKSNYLSNIMDSIDNETS